MAYNKNENKINEEQIAAFLKETLKRVNSDNDPESLDQLKKIFKKNIPFSRRMYVAAYLVRQANSRGFRPSKGNDRFNRSDRFNRNDRPAHGERTEHFSKTEASNAEHAERAPRVQIDPSLATTIFISVGRNRRVFPRDLVGLLVSVAGLERDRIGDIRVLANYSFIQLFTEDCEKVIKALNDYDYRGRKLSVSYSRQKEDEGAEENTSYAEETVPSDVSNESSGIHAEESQESKIAEEQSVYAAQQSSSSSSSPSTEQPYSETTDDGQVKSHFGNGDTNYLV